MADNNEIIIDIVGKLDTIERQLGTLEKISKEQGAKAGAAFSDGLSVGALKIAGALAAVGGTIGAVLGLKDAVHEAIEAEKALNLFNSSLKNAGNFTEQASVRFEEFAKGLQKVTSFSDDVIISNASILASLGRLSGEGLERATKAAVDFAATGRVSLEGAFDAVAKAANGNTQSLGRFGIKIDETLKGADKFAEALRQIEGRFGGLAAAQGGTFGGSLDRIKNLFGDLQENIGKLITQSPVVVAFLQQLGKFLAEAGGSIEKFGKSGDVIGDLIKKILEFGHTIIKFVIAPIELLGNLFTASFAIAKVAIQTLVVELVTVPALLGEIIGNMIQFASVAGKVVGFFNAELGAKVTEGLQSIGTGISEFSANVRTTATENLAQFSDEAGAAVDNIFKFETTAKIDEFINKMQSIADNAAPIGKTISAGLGGGFDDVALKANKAFDTIHKTFQQGIVNVISAGAQAVGASLVKGGKAFEQFGKQVLNIIGDMAIQIGGTLIGIGIGIESIKASILTLSGGQAIAAGIALIALGGLLKALSGGGETSGVGAGTVGAGAGGAPDVGGGAFAATSPDLDATRAAGTKVAVNVEGNVFNQRDTGLEIARIIQEQFDTNGSVIAQGAIA